MFTQLLNVLGCNSVQAFLGGKYNPVGVLFPDRNLTT